MMDTVLQDLRYALRTLQRAPLFTLVAVLTLGLGIGATTVVFTILNGVVLRPLQYEASDRLFGIWEQNEQGNYRLGSYPAFRDWRAQSDVFEALAYIRGSSDLMPGHDGARRVGAAFVSDEFFEVLRGQPLIGRLFSPDEQRPGGAPVAVLTHALWREAFGGDRRVIGSTIRLNAATYTVVGVLPDWFQFPSWAGVYLPLSTILPTDRILAQRGFHADSRIVAKLKPDVSIKQAQAAMAAIQSRLATAYPADNRGWTRVQFVSLFEEELRFERQTAMTLEPREIQRVRDNVQEQALKIIRNRIDQFGVAEPTVQAQGADEIVVQLPGIQDPERAKELIGRTALLEFRLLAEGPQAGTVEHPGPGVQVLYGRSDTGRRQAYLVERRTLMTGDVLTDASVSLSGSSVK